MKMEVISPSETFLHIWITRRYIPEDGNIKKYVLVCLLTSRQRDYFNRYIFALAIGGDKPK
jgi:hypothetical protein